MPAVLRIEIFPSNFDQAIDFYTRVMRFTLLRKEGTYAHLQRDSISLGLDAHHFEDALAAKDEYRRPPTGVEVVIEVDDLEEERRFILGVGWTLDADIKLQYWGLRDFRIVDPDGYYLRITEHSKKSGAKEDV